MKRFCIVFIIAFSCNLLGMKSPTKPQSIVFFRGMSTLGKGAICQEIVKQDARWQIVSDDDCAMETELALCKKQFPEQFATIAEVIASENLFHAIKHNEVLYKPEMTGKQRFEVDHALAHIQRIYNTPPVYDKEEVKKNTKELIKTRIKQALNNKYNVISDSWMLGEADFKEFGQHYKVITAFCYIPLNLLIESLIETDSEALKTGNLKNKRFFWHILNSFERLLKGKPRVKLLDFLNKQDLEESLELIQDELPDNDSAILPFTHQEMTVNQLNERRKEYDKLFCSSDIIKLFPDLDYDIVIEKRSSKICPLLHAKDLLRQIELLQ